VLLALAAGLVPQASGQTIRYQIDAGTPVNVTSGQDITINVGTVNGTVLLRIWDPALVNGLPDDDVGKITINGSLGTGGELRVLVAGPPSTWPSLPIDNFALTVPGLRHLGLNGSDGIEITDSGLRAKTRLAAFTSDDIRGVIEVGQVQRVQGGLAGTTPRGTISASITAIATDADFSADAIGYISAGNGITGDIIAVGSSSFDPATTSTYATIGRVLVGPSTNPAVLGIQGDILAEKGAIRSIYTTGPIDSGTGTRLKITAGNGIKEIRAAADDSSDVVARDFVADIVSNKAMLDNPATFPYNSETTDGALGLIETKGNLTGAVHAANLAADPRPAGIYVRGAIYADIDIDLNGHYANIVAGTILGDIRIGNFLKGCIIAVGDTDEPNPPTGFIDGHIASVVIGRGPVPAGNQNSFYLNDSGPGFCGVSGLPFVPSGATPELLRESWFTSRGFDDGTIDGVIRAANSIGEIDLASMSRVYQHVPNHDNCKTNAPRIEAPLIGSVVIDDLATGSIWSGVFDDTPDPGDMPGYYAEIGSLNIGCVRNRAAIWMRDWSEATVHHNMFGTIHVPQIALGARVMIGGILGDEASQQYASGLASQLCLCKQWSDGLCGQCTSSQSSGSENPRDPDFPYCNTVFDDRGRVWVHTNEKLVGHVVVNGASKSLPEAALWTGAVNIGELSHGCAWREISPVVAPSAWRSPHYDVLASALGGGRVGLVPFHLHDTDCDPPNTPSTPPTFLNSAFCQLLDPEDDRTITLRFYGDVRVDHATQSPVTVTMDGAGSTDFSQFMNVTVRRPADSSRSHEITLTGSAFTQLIAGTYRIRPVLDANASNRLICDGLLNSADPSVGENFEYVFVLLSNCNLNGIDDAADIAAAPVIDVWPMDGKIDECYPHICWGDYNGDGSDDQGDVACMSQIIAGDFSCMVPHADPDFNRDGSVDQGDLALIILYVAGAGCP